MSDDDLDTALIDRLRQIAARYEEAAQRLRKAIGDIRDADSLPVAPVVGVAPTAVLSNGVAMSEAIRIVLGGSQKSMRPRDILAEIRERKISLQTKSTNLDKLIGPTLAKMKRVRQVDRDGSGWVLTGGIHDRP